MTHNEWVQDQFTQFKRRPSAYRNVLLITSFIEAVVINEASSVPGKDQKFKPSLKRLGLEIDPKNEEQSSYAQDCQYKGACLIETNLVRVRRNELLHQIIQGSVSQRAIEDKIREMAKNIERICTESDLIRRYFDENYGFDPAKLV